MIVLTLVCTLSIGSINPITKKISAEEINIDEDEDEIEFDLSEDNFDVSFIKTAEWSNHYSAEVTVKNISSEKIEDWELSFNLDGKISQIWDAHIVDEKDKAYIVKNNKWNQDIEVGGTVKFGLIVEYSDGTDDNEPYNYNMSKACGIVEKDYDVSYNISSKWDGGLIGNITITNKSEQTIEDWKVKFKSDISIQSIWNAKIELNEDNYYYLNNANYNADIEPNKSVSFGFSASYDKNTEIDEIQLFEMKTYVEDLTDTDNDGLIDRYETEVSNTLVDNNDTDGDGLTDGDEVIKTFTDPLKCDSDDNGIPDGNEDLDADGLNNQQEFLYGTDYYEEDTDSDGLTDGDEVNKYSTDPLNEDTDEDGLSDGEEVDMGLDPIISDTDGKGIEDGEKIIPQTFNYEEDESSIVKKLLINSEVRGSIYDAISVEKTISGDSIKYEIDNEDLYELKIKLFLQDNVSTDSITINKIGDESTEFQFINNDDGSIGIAESISDEKIELEIKNISGVSKMSKSLSLTKKSISTSNKNKLKSDIKKLHKKYVKHPLLRTYSSDKAIDIIYANDSSIESEAKKWGMNKALMQAILYNEIVCIQTVADSAADSAVISYYVYKHDLENYMKMNWIRQLVVGPPNVPLIQKEDCSTGIGQCFASTAIKALNYTAGAKGKKYNYNKWKQREKVWFSLHDNDSYSAKNVGKVLKMESAEVKGIQLSSPKKKDAQLLLSKYVNSDAKKVGGYGKRCYKYYKLFKKYN